MKTKSALLLLLLVVAAQGIVFGQLGIASATYSAGDISTDKYFTYYSGTQSSTCPATLTVTIPVGATIISTDVSYDMTSDANSSINKQRSHFRCVSPGGLSEASMTNGPGIYVPGTHSYSRTGLDVANGFVGGGDVEFELHAGATYYKHYCSIDSVKVDNNTWTITIIYIPPGYPEMAFNPNPLDAGLFVGLDDDITWDFGANTNNYDVYFGTDNPPTTKVVDFAAAGANGSYDPGTMNETETYYWQIVSHNANGYTQGPVWSFTTVCGSFVTPFTEDFESVTIPDLPYCWTKKVISTSTSAYIKTNNYYGNNGPNCVGFSNSSDADPTLIFVSPQVDIGGGSLADKMVNFSVMGFSYPNLIVGTMSDPNDETTFTPYESFLVYDYHIEHNVYFNSYVGTDTYIAFKMDPSTSYQELHIDDITIDDLPSCIKPEGLFADNMTINSAWLNWTDLNGATSWNIEYGLTGFTPTGIPTVSGVSNPHQITGLLSSTEYDFYVQTDCGGGDVSGWSGPATFLTPCDYFTTPLSENFDASLDLPVCWTGIVQTLDGWTINGIQNYNANSPSNAYHMENGSDQTSTLILSLPPFSSLSDKRLKFYVYNNTGEYGFQIGTMSNPNDAGTFTAFTTVTTTTSYQEYDVWFNTYTGSDAYIAFKHSNTASFLGFYIDDVVVEDLPSCLAPSSLNISNVTDHSAQVNWTESGSAIDWIIELGTQGFTPGTGTYLNQYTWTNSGTSQSFPLTALSSASLYDVYIQADCGSGDLSEWSGPASFLTGFTKINIPVNEDFETGFSSTVNNLGNAENWTINNSLSVSGTSSAHNAYSSSNDNVLFISGNLDFTGKSIIGLSFWQIAKTTGNSDHCYVEISTDGGTTFDQLPASTYLGEGDYSETGLTNYPEGPCFDEYSYADWGTSSVTPDNTWWKHEAFDLSGYGTYDNVVIRFRLVSDSWNERYGWLLDDITIDVHTDPVVSVNPLTISEDVTPVMPANVDLSVENLGGFALAYNASVVYDEIDLLNENFDTGLSGSWTVVNNGSNDVTWVDTLTYGGYNFDGTRFMVCDGNQSYAPGTNYMDDELITPVIDASAYSGGALLLEYDQAFDANYTTGDTAKVYVYDGSEWILIYESWTDDGLISYNQNGVHKSFDVTPYANANFQVKFHYIDGPVNQAKYFAIDNFRLRATMGAFGWLTVDDDIFTSGSAFEGEGPKSINVGMNAAGLAVGTYNADIEITSNDPVTPNLTIPVTMNVYPGIALDLKVFLEGPYDEVTGNMMYTDLMDGDYLPFNQPYDPPFPYYDNPAPVWQYGGTESVTELPVGTVDWILVQLRDAADAASAGSANAIATQAAFLLSDGSVVGTDGGRLHYFNTSISQNLYVVIYHRNHLGVMSNNAVTTIDDIHTYDFSTGADQVFGGSNGHKEIGTGVWGMVAGDGNGNGLIQNTDETAVWKIDLGTSGYHGGDFDLNGLTQNSDETGYWVPNLGGGGQIPSKGEASGYQSQIPK
ncbi:MAG: fibronectin type III domain-containing protein [Bacteroidetes bacterium]|nr:fibronectin type III domain-containing protein [Bacteroidota bacterium]